MDTTFLVSTWNTLVLQLCYVFTEPTAGVWRQIALGWVLRRGPATVTGMFRTIGKLADRHWTVYHKFFYRARWSLDALSTALMSHVILPMILESGQTDAATGRPVADLAIDDTTAGRYGKHVAHAGWFHDASATGPATKGTVIHWAHNWVVGAVTLRLKKWPLMRWVLPCVFALYRKPDDCNRMHPFATRHVLAARMVQEAAAALPGVLLRVSADGAYAGRDFIHGLPEEVNLVSRIRCDAAVNALPPTGRRRGKAGRPRLKGHRLPTPQEMAARRKKGWVRIIVKRQGQEVERKVLGITCLWYHVCRTVPIRIVMVRDPVGRQKDDFFFSTDASVSDAEIVQRYYDRWGVEEAILEAKQQMGFESTRGWCSKTVNCQAPLAMVLVTLVKAWYARCAAQDRSLRPEGTPWQPCKTRPSFLDMLSALRRALWQHRISPKSRYRPQVEEMIETVSYALCAAA
jgi:hypothetical protein